MFSAGMNRNYTEGPKRTGFLEELYLNRFNKGRFQDLAFRTPDPRVEEIIRRFRKLIRGFPPLNWRPRR